MQPGIHLVHKPVGATSFSLVLAFLEEVRASGMNPRKLPVVHGGALDPFAEGLMLLLAGPATRLMELMHPIPKSYEAILAWGAETDNGDLLGKIVAQGDASKLTPAALEAALPALLGWQEQVPPAFSNKRVDGERAHEKARRGEEVTLPPSRVYLHAARFVSHDLPRTSRLQLVCRGGYYVRSLARDLGRALGCRAHLSALSRSAIGPWQDPGPGARGLIQGAALLPWLPSRQLSDAEARRIGKNQSIPIGELSAPVQPVLPGFPGPEGPIRALHGGKLVALLEPAGPELRVAIALRAPI